MLNTAKLTKKPLLLLLLPMLLLLWPAAPAHAQEPEEDFPAIDWQELRTTDFIIVYAESVEGVDPADCACGIENAQFYAGFVDDIYQNLVSVFGIELDTPINLRLFPTEESYYQVNPLAEQIPGVIAHALNNREEIAIALPRTQRLTEDEITNNMRHELTHFFASLLSDSKLNTGFQEGIAQYLEKPNDRTGYDPALLNRAYDENRLLTWAELDKPENIFKEPQVAYPQALSITAFLVDRYSFTNFVDFIKANATEEGYRTALEATYGKSAEELEAEWLEYLPEYFNGRWKINSIYSYDLSRVTQLVEKGAYTDAETELVEIIELLETTDQTETLAQAEALLSKVHQGQAAHALANEARQALQANDYPLAIAKGHAAIEAYEALAYRERIPEVQTYIHRAELGQNALSQLSQGEQLLKSFRFFEAEQQIHEATVLLQSLGNQTAAQRGAELLTRSTHTQSVIGYAMLAIGAALLLVNGVRRILYQLSANPLEVEFT